VTDEQIAGLKIVCPFPTYKRKEITIETIRQLQRQTIPVEVLLIGSCDEDKEVARATGVPYFHCPNEPFVGKVQFSLDKARELNPDYVLRCGSDDWLSSNWCKFMLSKFDVDTGFGATFVCHTVRYLPSLDQASCNIQIIRHVVYKGTPRYGESLSPGRLWSRTSLDKIDWQLTKNARHDNVDGTAARCVKKSGAKTFLYKGNAITHLAIKGPWRSKHSWKKLIAKKNTVFLKYPKRWLKKHFPGSLAILERLFFTTTKRKA
jgi:glycosyltransferase involved in cell wall biosynthesis